ncbi:MAG: Cyclic pyranopterin monophosphate synthase [Candidatus Izimaplasma bacterium HR2]|nr:MAG: Cyclic pyranopterin monophosphate synthase [Candidatus Izimaplasma bacterium HR2]
MRDAYYVHGESTVLLISKQNGNSTLISKKDFNNGNILNKITDMNDFKNKIEFHPVTAYSKDIYGTIFISIHISSKCNLNCSYCFRDDNKDNSISFAESKKFIDLVIEKFPNGNKFIVDLSGSGEPLLNLDLLLQINEYCKIKRDEILKEITVMIATNGTLLSSEMVELLQSKGIIFGVSVDSSSKTTSHRVDFSGKPVHRKIIKNIKKIKERGFLGAAYTLTGKTTDIVKDLKYLYKFFPTISIKPVRSDDREIGINSYTINKIKKIYNDLYNFLLKEAYNDKLSYFIALLDGDDYFAKFLYRAILNIRVNRRCDAGLGRYSLATDGKIYVCPAAVNIKELEIGDIENGINHDRIQGILSTFEAGDECASCFAQYYCGGECMVNIIIKHINPGNVDKDMCIYRRHLVYLALCLVHNVGKNKPNILHKLSEYCELKSKRNVTNPDIIKVANRFGDKYSFTEIMRIEFEEKDKFALLLSQPEG